MSARLRLGLMMGAGLLTLTWVLAHLVAGPRSVEPLAPGPPGDGTWLPPVAGSVSTDTSPVAAGRAATPAADTRPAGASGTSGELSEDAVDEFDEGAGTPPRVHSEEEPEDEPLWAAVPVDTPPEVVGELAAAVEARLIAELTGEGREAYPEVVWRTAPCCSWVDVTGLVADFTISETVRVIVEWETDQGRGSGPTYWMLDETSRWVAAIAEASA